MAEISPACEGMPTSSDIDSRSNTVRRFYVLSQKRRRRSSGLLALLNRFAHSPQRLIAERHFYESGSPKLIKRPFSKSCARA
jgi:hypothetical protein